LQVKTSLERENFGCVEIAIKQHTDINVMKFFTDRVSANNWHNHMREQQQQRPFNGL